jgi:ABC-type spermidine/putrescine transport system permease subunit II
LSAGLSVGWLCLPVSAAFGASVALTAARFGKRVLAGLRTLSVACLVPGVCLALMPGLPHLLAPHLFPRGLPFGFRFGCRSLGVVPALLLPVLGVLVRLPAGQSRAAAGLGAGTAARLRLLWLPQLGPACLFGVVLAGLVDLVAILRP